MAHFIAEHYTVVVIGALGAIAAGFAMLAAAQRLVTWHRERTEAQHRLR